MELMGSLKVIGLKSKMELAVPQVVIPVKISEPGQLQLKIRCIVSQVGNDKDTVFRLYTPLLFQSLSSLITGKGTL